MPLSFDEVIERLKSGAGKKIGLHARWGDKHAARVIETYELVYRHPGDQCARALLVSAFEDYLKRPEPENPVVAVLSDIHGNLEALQSVVADARKEGAGTFLVAGDIVGYGPKPAECVDLVKRLGAVAVRGNHDELVVNHDEYDYMRFNPAARQSILWTRGQLNKEHLEYLGTLPYYILDQEHGYQMVHGSLASPFRYIDTIDGAVESFKIQSERLCFIGHTHVAAVVRSCSDGVVCDWNTQFPVYADDASKLLINVGSVGQPRDNDARASYALWNRLTGQVVIRRVDYDIGKVQKDILEVGLPQRLSERLAVGR